MTRIYELVVLFSPELGDADLRKSQEVIESLVAKHKGKINSVDAWGLKTLAYKIRGFSQAHYVFYLVEMDSSKVANLERDLKLSEQSLRHLIVLAENEPQLKKVSAKKG